MLDPRVGVMLHYDGSGSDEGAVSWFGHPDCEVSYQWLVLDDGSAVRIAPNDRRAYHAGRCRPSIPRFRYSSANSAFYGIAAATNNYEDVTPLQTLTIAYLTRWYFEHEGWPLADLWRITTHRSEAWKRGRKSDPEGGDPKNPILAVEDIRQLLGKIEL